MTDETAEITLEAIGFQCLCLQSRMTARAVTRRYNHVLQDHGLSITEFSLLVTLGARPGLTITELAELLCFERTTLVRNLKGLADRGLIDQVRTRGPAVVSTLTDLGKQFLSTAIPLWKQAQAEVKARLGATSSEAVLGAIRELRQAVME